MNLPVYPNVNSRHSGLTLVETLLVLSIIIMLSVSLPTVYRGLLNTANARLFADETAGWLRQMAERASAGWQKAGHGLYVDAIGRQFVLYRGDSFLNRVPTADELVPWPNQVQVVGLGAAGGDFNFVSVTGLPRAIGDLDIRDELNQVRVTVNPWGAIMVLPFDEL